MRMPIEFASTHIVSSLQSVKSVDALAQTLPCEPPPVALAVDPGLNRMQQLLAAQALIAPAIPSYAATEGGVVQLFFLSPLPVLQGRMPRREGDITK